MSVPKGAATYKVRKAIDDLQASVDAAGLAGGIQSTDITDATTVGKALIVAANAAAGRTAIGAQVAFVSPPASAAATGVTGSVAVDTGFIYVCTATNTWKRVAIATW